MSLVRYLGYFRRAQSYRVIINGEFSGHWVYINHSTFAVCINGKHKKRYSAKKIPKYINRRGAIFV